MQAKKYFARPTIVQAVQFTGSEGEDKSVEAIRELTGGASKHNVTDLDQWISIETPEEELVCETGEWVIKEGGKIFVLGNIMFSENYKAEEAPAPHPSHAVKRYDPAEVYSGSMRCTVFDGMKEDSEGDYVTFESYDQVRKQRDVLLEAAKESLPAVQEYYKQAIRIDGYIPALQVAIAAAEKEGE